MILGRTFPSAYSSTAEMIVNAWHQISPASASCPDSGDIASSILLSVSQKPGLQWSAALLHPGKSTGSSWGHGQQIWDVLLLYAASQILSSTQKAQVDQSVGLYVELTASECSLCTWTWIEKNNIGVRFQHLFDILISMSNKILSDLWPPHLVSLKTSFSAWRRLSVVTETMSNTTPTPLLAIFCALSGWSPEIGTITMGTAWHSPSKRPCEPAWVMKARAPGCANTHTTQIYQMVLYVTGGLTCASLHVSGCLQTQQVVLRNPFHYLHIFWDTAWNLSSVPPYYLQKNVVSYCFLMITLIYDLKWWNISSSNLLWNLSEGF